MTTEQKPEGRNVGLSAGLDAARRMEAAARTDNVIAFAEAKNAWDESGPHSGPVADAVQRLRDAWYHEGSPAARLECRRAMAELKRVMASNDAVQRPSAEGREVALQRLVGRDGG